MSHALELHFLSKYSNSHYDAYCVDRSAKVNYIFPGNRTDDLSMEAVAKFMFAASQEDELSFEKGSVLNVSFRSDLQAKVQAFILPGFEF